VAVKEIVDVEGMEVTAGSRVLAGRRAERDAEVVRRLRAAGAVVVGLTRSHEFAWGVTTWHERRGGTHNPWDLARVAGGSSGGSAAAVAAGMVPAAIGSDTAGSIRIPASFCGVVGFKPTYDAVSRDGVFPLAPSLDTVGTLARTVADAARVFRAIAVRPEGEVSLSSPLRWGVGPPPVPLAPDHRAVFDAAVAAARGLGSVVHVPIPAAAVIMAAFADLQLYEAHAVHVRLGLYPRYADRYGADVRARLELAAPVGEDRYRAAIERRAVIRRDLAAVLDRVDALLMPTTAATPPFTDRPDVAFHGDREVPIRDLVIPFGALHTLAGVPSCSIPAGFDAAGLPVGVQVVTAAGEDERCLAAAAALEAAIGFDATPPITAG
jgi:aspartyl-tRNA(Asn)/glutamyl-tRNA(Gln) amidotransferase subunit A